MRLTVIPGSPLRGVVALPGDKSLSHRSALFAALAEGQSRIENFLVSGVTRAMLDALRELGVPWSLHGTTLMVDGRGLRGLASPSRPLNCGNSATTLRLLAGAAAAAGIGVELTGSEGLRRRPMERIVEPLRRMGVEVTAAPGGTAPLRIAARPVGQALRPLHETLPVASAQVKTCLLLAALSAHGETVLDEPGPSRDHTERMLAGMGVHVESDASRFQTRLTPPAGAKLRPLNMRLPGDFSSAAFLIVAGLVTPGSEVTVTSVGLNPTRTGLLDALAAMGAQIEIFNESVQGGEKMGDVRVRASVLRGTRISGALVVRMIDEFSVFGAAAALVSADPPCSQVREAAELRTKEF